MNRQLSRRSVHSAADFMVQELESRRYFAAPVIDSIASQTIPSGRTLQVPLTASDADGDPISYSFQSSSGSITTKLHTGNRYLRVTVSGNNISGQMVFQLFDDVTPHTASIIAGLAQAGFYNGLTFQRVDKTFVIQGGDPNGDGSGGPGFEFDDEINKSLLYDGIGVLAMARSNHDTGGSQFFVTAGPSRASLDYQYTDFGQLVRGFDVLTKILNTPVNGETPVTPVVMTKAEIIEDKTDGVLQLTAGSGTGTTSVTVTATDSHGNATHKIFNVTRVADTVNDPPILGPVSDVTTPVDTPVKITLSGFDFDGEGLSAVASFVNDSGSAISVPNVTFAISGNVITVTPTHGFTGKLRLGVGVHDANSGNDTQIIQIGVGDKPASGSAKNIVADAGTVLSKVTLATFKDSDSAGTASNWTVNPSTVTRSGGPVKVDGINWGDGTVTGGTITKKSDGTFIVTGSHTYAHPGIYPVIVGINGDKGAHLVLRGKATVGSLFSLASGVLTVNGLSSSDTIALSISSSQLIANVDGAVKKFTNSSITRILVQAGDGNDTVTVGTGVIGLYINGGTGNDNLSGGDGNDTVTGGAGKNTISGNGGDDRLNGSGGPDQIFGGAGDDRMYGNGGDDKMDGGGNVDRLFGGAGNDILKGGSSNDKLYGEDGNDILLGGKGSDLEDGGLGIDSAEQDGTDVLKNIP